MTNVYGATAPSTLSGSTVPPKGVLTEFSCAANATLTGVRYYTPVGTAQSDLNFIVYNGNGADQTQLANLVVTVNLAVGWHTYNFVTPIALTAGTHYRILFGKEATTNNILYGYTLSSLPLTANGITLHGSIVRTGGTFVWAENSVPALTDTDAYGVDIEVTTVTALDVSAGTDQSIFTTQTASLLAVATGGAGTKTYTWTKVSGPAGSFSSASTAATVFTPSGGAGTYTLRVLTTDTSGTDQDDVVVTVAVAPTLVSYDSIASSTGLTATGGTVLAVISDSSDATLLTTSDNPTAVLLDGYLPPMAAPGAGQNFITRIRADRPGSSSGTVTGRLYEGATLRSTIVANIPSSLADVDISFPAADLTAITLASWTAITAGTHTAMRVTLSFTAAV